MDYIKSKYFPFITNYDKLKYDKEGLWSITMPNDAKIISDIILKEIGYNKIIFDGTAGIGGNTLSFSKTFKKVISIELDKNRFDILKNNINIYNYNNIILYNDNCFNLLNLECDVYFFDPPWGGPNYKKINKLKVKLSNKSLYDIIMYIKNNNIQLTTINNKKIFFKIPTNYDLLEFSNFNYKIYKIKQYNIIVIY